jgi:hypothetical protein
MLMARRMMLQDITAVAATQELQLERQLFCIA